MGGQASGFAADYSVITGGTTGIGLAAA